jgi:4-methylaminobutanoate oxidase (formaldehyde-forming)
VAYHLCRAGVTDVLVLERNDLSSGATPRSAGCFFHSRSEPSTIRMISRTRAAIVEIESLLGDSLDFRQAGCIRAALTDERERELRAMETVLAGEGMPADVLDAGMARSLCPWLDLRSARRIVFLPFDGYVDGARLGLAYARAARVLGARIVCGSAARGIVIEGGCVRGVATDRGVVKARCVIDAAGAWSAEVASWLGWGFAAAPTRSQYWITAPDGSGRGVPNVQLPDLRVYLRSEVGGLVVGFQELRSRTFDAFGIEHDISRMNLEEENELERLAEKMEELRIVAPEVDSWGFAHHVTGLSMYTPDGKFLIGRVPGVEGFLLAGGCCGSGVSASGGFGQVIAEIVTGRPHSIDVSLYRPERFGRVDPRSVEFRERCAAARAGKTRGRADRN